MTPAFADTFFWIALLTPNDNAHDRARAIIDRLSSPVLTTTWVLMETGDALHQPRTRRAFASLLAFLDRTPLVTVLPPSLAQFTSGVQLYKSRADKEWSLTDCSSFVVMEERGIREALTRDHHFEQAGFVALLK